MLGMVVLLFAAAASALAGGSGTSGLDATFQIRVTNDPPIPFPVSRFSVRRMNTIHFRGRYYAYADVAPWDNPDRRNTYHTSIHAYSSDDGSDGNYEGEILPVGRPGQWDDGGVATPGTCVAEGKILLAYSGRAREDGSGKRSIGLAVATNPLAPSSNVRRLS